MSYNAAPLTGNRIKLENSVRRKTWISQYVETKSHLLYDQEIKEEITREIRKWLDKQKMKIQHAKL